MIGNKKRTKLNYREKKRTRQHEQCCQQAAGLDTLTLPLKPAIDYKRTSYYLKKKKTKQSEKPPLKLTKYNIINE